MAVNIQSGTTIAFDQFWQWLEEHPNCIVRAGTPDVVLFDHETLHWFVGEDGEHNPLIQLIAGKVAVGEIVLDVRDVLYVQSVPDDAPKSRRVVFELVGGPKEDPYAVYHFLMSHGMEGMETHPGSMKH